jgi:hypothetical protein
LKIESRLGSIPISDQGDATIKGNKITIQATQNPGSERMNVGATPRRA